MRRALAGEDLRPLCQSLLQRAGIDSSESGALLDAAILFEFQGQPEIAAGLRDEALRLCRHYRLPARRRPARLRLLALMAPGPIMANVPIECLLDDSDIDLDLYFATVEAPDPAAVPEHDLLFVAIGESEANRPLLEAWAPRVSRWPRPVLNHPSRILGVARDRACRRLQGQPGVVVPTTDRVERAQLQALASAGASMPTPLGTTDGRLESARGPEPAAQWPMLVRPVDSHAGQGLTKVDTPQALSGVLANQASHSFFVSPFVDYRSADGSFRKFRVVLIAGRPFAVHMAISEHWMIHYLNAGMDASASKRAEEAAFMADFERPDQGFAPRHAQALAAIHAAFGLDYLGIDCAETADGRLLIFEVDPAMVVHDMDPIDLYPYKPAAMRRVFEAFRAFLLLAAARYG